MLIKDKFRVDDDLNSIVQNGHRDHLQRTGPNVQPGQKLCHRLLPGHGGEGQVLVGHGNGPAGGQGQLAPALTGHEAGGTVGEEDVPRHLVHPQVGLVADHVERVGVGVAGVRREGDREHGESRYSCDSDQPFQI